MKLAWPFPARALLLLPLLSLPARLHAAASPYAWGGNSYGNLGDGTYGTRSTPVAVDTTGVLSGKTVIAMDGGTDHTLALTSDGKVYAWGENADGQLGTGSFSVGSKIPVAVDMSGVLSGKTVTAIAAGDYFSLALTSDGKLFTWGDNSNGQLGNGSTSRNALSPVAVDMTGVLSGKTVTAIASHSYGALVLTSDNKLYAWGVNGSGQLGNGATSGPVSTPVAVDMSGALSGKSVVTVASGFYHSLALTSDGLVYAWGDNTWGQIGDGTTTRRLTPVAVYTAGVLSGHTVTAIAATVHSLALTDDGQPVAWGYNVGALGDGTTTDRSLPVATDMTGVLSGQAVSFIAAGANDSLALAAPVTTTIRPACRFTYAANFGWLNWRTRPLAVDAPVIETAMAHGKVYSANVGWIDLGNGLPAGPTGHYTETGGDVGVNHDGAGGLSGYAYGANIGWIYFDPTIASPPRVDLITGALSGYAYSANCGWINLAGLCSFLRTGTDSPVAGRATGNGIADSWEKERSLAAGLGGGISLLAQTPGADYDGDGVSDVDEYLADTDPFNAASRPRIVSFSRNPATGDFDIDWTGGGRRVYTLYYSTDMVNWLSTGTPMLGTSASLTLPPALSSSRVFVKVQASLPLPQ